MGKHTQINEATTDTGFPNNSFFYDTDAPDPPTAMTLLSSTTDNAIARFDGTGGLLQNSSNVTLDDSGQIALSGVNQLRVGTQLSATDGVFAANRDDNAILYLAANGTGVMGMVRAWAASGTYASRSAVATSRDILRLEAIGYHGTGYESSSRILLGTDSSGTISSTSMPGRISFLTSANSSVSPTERMKIDSAGLVTISNNLAVSGKTTVASGSANGIEMGSSGPLMLAGTGTPSGVSAPVGSEWRQTDANTNYGSLVGIKWIKVGTGTVLHTDWYPDLEGRWVQYTPTISTSAGSGLTTSSAVGRFTQVGKLVHLRIFITVSAVGTGTTGASLIFTLPTNASAAADQMGYGRQDTGTGAMLQVRRLSADATKAEIWKYDNTSPIAVQTNIVHYTYEVA